MTNVNRNPVRTMLIAACLIICSAVWSKPPGNAATNDSKMISARIEVSVSPQNVSSYSLAYRNDRLNTENGGAMLYADVNAIVQNTNCQNNANIESNNGANLEFRAAANVNPSPQASLTNTAYALNIEDNKISAGSSTGNMNSVSAWTQSPQRGNTDFGIATYFGLYNNSNGSNMNSAGQQSV
ncbi:MAG: hypothetical protein PHV42_03005 [Candidatus Pacebacteria bacterium]|nr:hypothetical protein [Candidatus Paceibacterota bacterium]